MVRSIAGMRPAARILLLEAEALRPILEAAPPDAFDRPTVCDGWSVRDVLAHCGAALTRTATGDLHRFKPEDNQADVDARKTWALADVIAELLAGYHDAAAAIDAAGGSLDAIGLGEWVHGGDVREALDVPGAYASSGLELALGSLAERSDRDGRRLRFGPAGEPAGGLRADAETFVRLTAGRRPDPERYDLTGADPADLALFR